MYRKSKVLLDWLGAIAIAIIIAVVIENFLFCFAVVEGQSMMPTLGTKDRLLIGKLPITYKELEKGDLIIFNHSNEDRDELFVKRVVALENDHFLFKEGSLYINGEMQAEKYILSEEYLNRKYNYVEGIVPSGTIFALGDNRNDSNDSRSFGFVPKNEIRGRVFFRIWPLNELKAFVNPL